MAYAGELFLDAKKVSMDGDKRKDESALIWILTAALILVVVNKSGKKCLNCLNLPEHAHLSLSIITR